MGQSSLLSMSGSIVGSFRFDVDIPRTVIGGRVDPNSGGRRRRRRCCLGLADGEASMMHRRDGDDDVWVWCIIAPTHIMQLMVKCFLP
jgi:hypothetical protein